MRNGARQPADRALEGAGTLRSRRGTASPPEACRPHVPPSLRASRYNLGLVPRSAVRDQRDRPGRRIGAFGYLGNSPLPNLSHIPTNRLPPDAGAPHAATPLLLPMHAITAGAHFCGQRFAPFSESLVNTAPPRTAVTNSAGPQAVSPLFCALPPLSNPFDRRPAGVHPSRRLGRHAGIVHCPSGVSRAASHPGFSAHVVSKPPPPPGAATPPSPDTTPTIFSSPTFGGPSKRGPSPRPTRPPSPNRRIHSSAVRGSRSVRDGQKIKSAVQSTGPSAGRIQPSTSEFESHRIPSIRGKPRQASKWRVSPPPQGAAEPLGSACAKPDCEICQPGVQLGHLPTGRGVSYARLD